MRKETPKHKQQVQRIKAFIKRAEARGYRFDSDFKDNFSSYSTNKLKALKPAKLYALSTAISEETGKVVSGTEQRKYERSISTLKARATKLLKREEEKIKQNYYEYSGYDYSDTADASFTDIVLSNIEQRIEVFWDNEREYIKSGCRYLKFNLDHQISMYGREKVARALEEAPDEAKTYSNNVIFMSKYEDKRSNLIEFIQLIKGEALTMQEAQEIGEILENDSYEVDDSED